MTNKSKGIILLAAAILMISLPLVLGFWVLPPSNYEYTSKSYDFTTQTFSVFMRTANDDEATNIIVKGLGIVKYTDANNVEFLVSFDVTTKAADFPFGTRTKMLNTVAIFAYTGIIPLALGFNLINMPINKDHTLPAKE